SGIRPRGPSHVVPPHRTRLGESRPPRSRGLALLAPHGYPERNYPTESDIGVTPRKDRSRASPTTKLPRPRRALAVRPRRRSIPGQRRPGIERESAREAGPVAVSTITEPRPLRGQDSNLNLTAPK